LKCVINFASNLYGDLIVLQLGPEHANASQGFPSSVPYLMISAWSDERFVPTLLNSLGIQSPVTPLGEVSNAFAQEISSRTYCVHWAKAELEDVALAPLIIMLRFWCLELLSESIAWHAQGEVQLFYNVECRMVIQVDPPSVKAIWSADYLEDHLDPIVICHSFVRGGYFNLCF
jgi:hypothetical protein